MHMQSRATGEIIRKCYIKARMSLYIYSLVARAQYISQSSMTKLPCTSIHDRRVIISKLISNERQCRRASIDQQSTLSVSSFPRRGKRRREKEKKKKKTRLRAVDLCSRAGDDHTLRRSLFFLHAATFFFTIFTFHKYTVPKNASFLPAREECSCVYIATFLSHLCSLTFFVRMKWKEISMLIVDVYATFTRMIDWLINAVVQYLFRERFWDNGIFLL